MSKRERERRLRAATRAFGAASARRFAGELRGLAGATLVDARTGRRLRDLADSRYPRGSLGAAVALAARAASRNPYSWDVVESAALRLVERGARLVVEWRSGDVAATFVGGTVSIAALGRALRRCGAASRARGSERVVAADEATVLAYGVELVVRAAREKLQALSGRDRAESFGSAPPELAARAARELGALTARPPSVTDSEFAEAADRLAALAHEAGTLALRDATLATRAIESAARALRAAAEAVEEERARRALHALAAEEETLSGLL